MMGFGLWTFGLLDFWTFGLLDFWTFVVGFWFLRFLGFLVSSVSSVSRICGFVDLCFGGVAAKQSNKYPNTYNRTVNN